MRCERCGDEKQPGYCNGTCAALDWVQIRSSQGVAMRARVDGGWLYCLAVGGGTCMAFVPCLDSLGDTIFGSVVEAGEHA